MNDGDSNSGPPRPDPRPAASELLDAVSSAQHTTAEERRQRVNDLSQILARVGDLQEAVSGLVISEKGREHQAAASESHLAAVLRDGVSAFDAAIAHAEHKALQQSEQSTAAQAACQSLQAELAIAIERLADSDRQRAESAAKGSAVQQSLDRATLELQRAKKENNQLTDQLREALDGVTDTMLQLASLNDAVTAATKARDEALAGAQSLRAAGEQAHTELLVERDSLLEQVHQRREWERESQQSLEAAREHARGLAEQLRQGAASTQELTQARDDAVARFTQSNERHHLELEKLVDSHRERLDQMIALRDAEASAVAKREREAHDEIEAAHRRADDASRASLKLLQERDLARKQLGELTMERELWTQQSESQMAALQATRDESLARLAEATAQRDLAHTEEESAIADKARAQTEGEQMRGQLEQMRGQLEQMRIHLEQQQLQLAHARAEFGRVVGERDQAIDEVAQLVEQVSEAAPDLEQSSADELASSTLETEELRNQLQAMTSERDEARADALRFKTELARADKLQTRAVEQVGADGADAAADARQRAATSPPPRRGSRKTASVRSPRVSSAPEPSPQLPLTVGSPGVYRMTAVDIRDESTPSEPPRGPARKRKK